MFSLQISLFSDQNFRFIKKVIIAVADELHMDHVEDCSVNQILSAAEKNKLDMKSAQKTWVDDAIQDLLYLQEMRELDSVDTAAVNKKPTFSNVVPVSGLFLGNILRHENEVKTVVELWGNNKKFNNEHTHRERERERERG